MKAAIESDRTLGDKVEDLTVTTCSGYRGYDLSNHGRTLGTEWTGRSPVMSRELETQTISAGPRSGAPEHQGPPRDRRV